MDEPEPRGSGWYAVRCVFRSGWPPESANRAYEERITLWQADSFEHALERAENEAREYAAAISDSPDTYLDFAQAYHLSHEPAWIFHGCDSEVSLIGGEIFDHGFRSGGQGWRPGCRVGGAGFHGPVLRSWVVGTVGSGLRSGSGVS